MAYEESLKCVTIPANADLSAKQYFFGKVSNSSGIGQVAVCGDGEAAIGVIQNDPSSQGDATTVGISGISKVSAGGTITAGNYVASDASGEAVVAATGDIIAGIALESGVDGDIIPVLLDGRHAFANGL